MLCLLCVLLYIGCAALTLAIISLTVLRYLIKTSCKWNKSYVCLVGKTAIVTGANSANVLGIGFFTALDFAKRGAHVILACRNEERAIAACGSIIQQTNNKEVEYRLVDYTSLESIRKFAKDINNTVDRIDILVNNAGSAGTSNYETNDGLKLTWQINHFAPFLLTNLLLAKIKETPDSRIVIVASVVAKFANLNSEDINTYPAHKFQVLAKNTLYMWTKQANILFGRELSQRLGNSSTHVYIVHPGSVASNIWRRIPIRIMFWYKMFMKFIYRTSEEGAQTSIYCAVSQDCANESGEFYVDCKRVPMYSNCKDLRFAREVWLKSENIVALDE